MEPAGQAMHVLLDMVAAYDDEASEDDNDRAIKTAALRLNEIGAITATRDDETATTTVIADPLLIAAMTTIDAFLRQLALELGHDRLTVLRTIREHLDRVWRGEV